MEEIGRSTVVYDVTMDDLLAFTSFYNRNSPTLRKSRRKMLIGMPVCISLIALGVGIQGENGLAPALLIALAASTLLAALLGYHFKYEYPKKVRKLVVQMYSEDKNPGSTGQHTLDVDETGFAFTTDYSQTRCSWGKLVRIESEPGYTYLYTGATHGLIIPHASIISGDLRAVMAQIERHYHPEKLLVR